MPVPLLVAARVALFVAGGGIVLATVLSAVHTFVVPRPMPVALSRTVFIVSRRVFVARAAHLRRRGRELDADEALALYAPFTLLLLPVVWLSIVVAGYLAMFRAVGGRGWRDAFALSGSSLFTLGFDRPSDLPSMALSFSESALGIALLALLITYLPTLHAAFARREAAVALLEVRAGSPPSAEFMLRRLHLIGWREHFEDLWSGWEAWFVDLDESHTSLASLPFYRSPQPDRSWVTAAGAVLDAASLQLSTLEGEWSPQAALLVRSGYVALRHIADFYAVPYDPDPDPGDPISVTREEYDALCGRLTEIGVVLVQDRDQAWRDFNGWRVNYDAVLVGLATLVDAPEAPWSADRKGPYRRPPVFVRRASRKRQ